MSSSTNLPVAHVEPRVGRSVSLGRAAEMLQVSVRTVYYWIREGRLRTIRTLNGSQRVLVDSISATRTPGSPLGSSSSRAHALEEYRRIV